MHLDVVMFPRRWWIGFWWRVDWMSHRSLVGIAMVISKARFIENHSEIENFPQENLRGKLPPPTFSILIPRITSSEWFLRWKVLIFLCEFVLHSDDYRRTTTLNSPGLSVLSNAQASFSFRFSRFIFCSKIIKAISIRLMGMFLERALWMKRNGSVICEISLVDSSSGEQLIKDIAIVRKHPALTK